MKTMWLFLALIAGTVSVNAYAGREFSAEQIRTMVREGEILSLDQILDKNQQQLQGRLLDLEVEIKKGVIIYEMEFILDNGYVLELVIDAKSGQILDQEMKD